MNTPAQSQTTLGLRTYQFFAHLPWLRNSFKAKVLTVAFLGTHVPLLAVLAYFIYDSSVTQGYALWVLAIALAATLAGTVITILVLQALLRPVDLVLRMLGQFRETQHVSQPRLVLHDEMGALIDGTARTLAELEDHLADVALHDGVTGALNTRGLEQALRDCQPALPQAMTLIRLRIRNYAQWLASLGRNEIEFVARVLTNRLRLLFPPPCQLATTGHGQFTVLITGPLSEAELEMRMNQALDELTARLEVGAIQIAPVCALRIARADDLDSLNDLPGAAEAAVLAAEEHKGSNWMLAWQASSKQRTHMQLVLEIDRAIQEKQLVAVYQPRINIHSTDIESVEALVRWQHPKHGIIMPSQFIPAAEHTGKIAAIGRYMLDQAAAQASAWQRAGRNVTVSVNISAPQITATLAADIRTALARHGTRPQQLELEITETTLLASTTDSVATLHEIRDLSVAVALDDFGTGYSSLSYLSQLPIDRIKIDRSFVARLHNLRDRQIVEGIVALGQALELYITAEGVETRAQAAALLAMGCDEWQGFLFARPSRSEDIDWHPKMPEDLAPRQAPGNHFITAPQFST